MNVSRFKLASRLALLFCTGILLTGRGNTAAQTTDTPKRIDWNGSLGTRWQGDLQKARRANNVFQLTFTLDATVKASDQVDFGTRLITGDPRDMATAGWFNIGDYQNRKTVSISRIYGRYRPVPAITLTVGKLQTPFFHATEMLFDVDLSLEGLAQQFTIKNTKKTASLSLNLAEILINQKPSVTLDVSRTFLIGGQVVAQFTGASGSASVGAGVYAIANPDSIYQAQNPPPGSGKTVLITVANSNRPNATKTGFKSNFRVVSLTSQLIHNLGKWPLSIGLDYAMNPGASSERQGMSTIVVLGSTGKVRGTRFGVHAFHIESDVTLAAFSNIDFTQTNSNGFGLFVGHQLVKGLTLDAFLYQRKYDKPGSLITPTVLNTFRTRARFIATVRF